MQLSVKKSWRKELHSTWHSHGAFFSIAQKEEEERKKRERGEPSSGAMVHVDQRLQDVAVREG
jgi:hypothetical protein